MPARNHVEYIDGLFTMIIVKSGALTHKKYIYHKKDRPFDKVKYMPI